MVIQTCNPSTWRLRQENHPWFVGKKKEEKEEGEEKEEEKAMEDQLSPWPSKFRLGYSFV